MVIKNACWSPCEKSRLLDGDRTFLLLSYWISKGACHMFLENYHPALHIASKSDWKFGCQQWKLVVVGD
jgi:hypothetical protein